MKAEIPAGICNMFTGHILHSGESDAITGPVAERLRKWFDDYGN